MPDCRWKPRVERWVDGESQEPEAVSRHVSDCPMCAALQRQLRRIREGVRTVAVHEGIATPQFPAFLEGIRERVEVAKPRRRGIWAALSLTAAALIVALSVFAMFTGPTPAKARTIVENASTDVKGATVKTENSSKGNSAVVWVHVPRRDVL